MLMVLELLIEKKSWTRHSPLFCSAPFLKLEHLCVYRFLNDTRKTFSASAAPSQFFRSLKLFTLKQTPAVLDGYIRLIPRTALWRVLISAPTSVSCATVEIQTTTEALSRQRRKVVHFLSPTISSWWSHNESRTLTFIALYNSLYSRNR